MKTILAVFAVAGLLAGLDPRSAPAQERPPAPPHVTVSGEASVGVTPDVAHLSAGVVSEAKTAREAAAANNVAMAAVMAAIKAAGIADRDVQTSGYYVSPLTSSGVSTAGDRPRITGFRVGNNVMLTLRDLDKVGATIDALVTAGANSLGSIEFAVSEPSKALDSARADAIADARRKAELYAKAAGASLGRVLTISEEVANPGPVFQSLARAASAPPIAVGERTLRVSIVVSFELAK